MKKSNVNLNKIASHYTNSINKHGDVSNGVGWSDMAEHSLRFDKLCSVVEDKNIAASYNDLGCGYGSLWNYLSQNNYNVALYRGHDISDKQIEAAKLNVKSKIASFSDSPSLDRISDYSIASGIFNVCFEENKTKWHNYILQTLENINKKSRIGFSFNLLSSYVDWHEQNLYYADPLFLFDYCKKNFSKKVSLIHDYPLWEFTIIVKKD